MTEAKCLRSPAPKIAGDRVATVLIACDRLLADRQHASVRDARRRTHGSRLARSGGVPAARAPTALLDVLDSVCGNDLHLQAAACNALRAERDAARLPYALRRIDSAGGPGAVSELLDRAIRTAAAGEWDGLWTLRLPQGPPTRKHYEGLCLLAEAIDEIELGGDPCSSRDDWTRSVSERIRTELDQVNDYLASHPRTVRRRYRQASRRRSLADGPCALPGRTVGALLARIAIVRRSHNDEIPF